MKTSEIGINEDIDTLQTKQLASEINENNESSIQSNGSLKNYSEVLLAPENNTSSSNMNLNSQILSQHQTSPSHPASATPSTPFQQTYLSSFTNMNPTRNIWIKRFTDIDATKIPFSGEDVHDLKVSILQFFGPSFIGSSAELGFVTVWKGGKKLLPGQVIDAEFLKDVSCEEPLLLKNTHNQLNNSNANSPVPNSTEILDFDPSKTINLESNEENQISQKQTKDSKKSSKMNNISLNDVNGLTLNGLSNIQGLSNINGMNNINFLNQLSNGNGGNNSPNSLRQLNGISNISNLTQLNHLNGINGLNQLNVTTSNTSTSIQSISSLAPLNNSLVNLNSIQASLNTINATTAASLNTNTPLTSNNIGMNNIINGLVSLQNLNSARGLTTSTFNDNISISSNNGTSAEKINVSGPLSTVANNTSIPSLHDPNQNNTTTDTNNIISEINSKVESPVPDQNNNSHHSDDEEVLDPEEQLNAIYPQNVEIPKEIEDAVHRNTNRGWRLITIIDTNDIPKFFEDQPQDWRVQRSATDRYPGYLVINYIGGLEGERNNMPSKALNLSWSPETNDPSSKMYRKSKDLIDKQSMMYGSRFFCKGYPWCPSIVSSLNSIDAETTDISSKNGKKLAKKLRTSLTQSAAVNTSSPPPEVSNIFGNSMKRNFDCMRHGSRNTLSDDDKNNNSSQNHRSLKVSCNATLKIEIYASNLKKAVVYGKNLHGILGPISEFRPSDRIMSEACRAALSKDITYTRFLRQAEAMAIKYNIPKHRIPNRTQIRTFFERSRRGNRLAGYSSNAESPSVTNASLNTSHALLNSTLVSNIQAISILNQQHQPQESTNYSTITTSASKVSPNSQNHLQIPSHSPRLTLSNYHTSTLPNANLVDNVDNVDVDMYSNNDLGIIKITPSFNSMNSIGFNGITASIANDLTTGINTSIFTHTNSNNSSNTNNNNTNFHSSLFNS